MNEIRVTGGRPLMGELTVQGSKNAALPLMAASVLHEGTTVLHNCPRIQDVETMSRILRQLGCIVTRDGGTLVINAEGTLDARVPKTYGMMLRASVVLMGALLGRCRKAVLPYPGGCIIGCRPVDYHIKAMEALGAEIVRNPEEIFLKSSVLRGVDISLDFPSVGATENAILGAVRAEGTTVIKGCAREPEIGELCSFLCSMGADIRMDDGNIIIKGTQSLRDCEYTLMADRIVAGTYLLAAVGTGGAVRVNGAKKEHLEALCDVLMRIGASVTAGDEYIEIDIQGALGAAGLIRTEPYPGFPTDLQSQLMAVLCRAEGISEIEENMFEQRFLIVEYLNRMGAQIFVDGKRAGICGVRRLVGTSVRARELRGGAALVTAGLFAEGTTQIRGCGYIDRGYEDICRDLKNLGAEIERLT